MEQTLMKQDPVALARHAVTVEDLQAQIAMLHNAMKSVMKKGTHYGTVPGCGDKPTLLKPGAEVIMALFRLAANPVIEELQDNGAKTYRVKVDITTANGMYLGSGVGECSSDEEKYKWKRPVCDEEWNDTPENRRREKYDRYGKKYKQIMGNPSDVANCVTPDTLILTHDLQWVPAGELVTGDVLLGVEENVQSQYARRFSIGKATVHGLKEDDLFQITFADGRSVKCNGEHKWLVKKIGLKGTEWVPTEQIYGEVAERKGRPRKWTIMSVGAPWSEDKSKSAGYLAGLFDADGSLGVGAVIITFAQQDNAVLAAVEQGTMAMDFDCAKSACKSDEELNKTINKRQVYNVRLRGGLFEQMRFLGTLRPPRLIDRWLTLVDITQRRLEGPGSGSGKPQEIVSIEKAGKGEVVMLSTSCSTYIANGFVCHNTILKMAKKRALIDACLTCTAASDIFTQDIEDLPEGYQGATEPEVPKGKPPVKPPKAKSEAKQEAKPDAPPPEEKRLRVKLGKMLIDLAEGNENDARTLLVHYSEFEGSNGKVDGVKSLNDLSGKRLQTVYGKVKKAWEESPFYEPEQPPIDEEQADATV